MPASKPTDPPPRTGGVWVGIAVAVGVLVLGGVLYWRGAGTGPRRAGDGAGRVQGGEVIGGAGNGVLVKRDPLSVSGDVGGSLTGATGDVAAGAGAGREGGVVRPRVLKWLEAMKAPGPEGTTLKAEVDGMPMAELAAALKVLGEPGLAGDAASLRRMLLQSWAERDIPGAVRWVSGLASGDARVEAYASVARGWANRDAEAALTWARSLSDEGERAAAAVEVIYELTRNDPMRALTAAVELPETRARDEAINHAAARWATQAPEDALAWAGQIPDTGLRERVLTDVLATWGEKDPAAAATKAVETLPAGRAQSDAVVSIVQHWAQQDPATVGAWVKGFPAGELGNTSAEALVRLWADQDREQAGNWLNTLEAGGLRDAAVAAYVDQILPDAPASAAEWAVGIREPELREAQLERVGARWLEVDAAAGRAWINSSPLSPEVKARLLRVSGDRPPAAAMPEP